MVIYLSLPYHWIYQVLLENKVLDIIKNNKGISSGKLRRKLGMNRIDFRKFLSYLIVNNKIFTKSILSKKTGKKYREIYLMKGIVEEL